MQIEKVNCCIVRVSGFAVVFAEDVPDITSEDVPSGESAHCYRYMGDRAKLAFKMRGSTCARNIMGLSMGALKDERIVYVYS
jgi:hypothetical protein